MHNHNEEQNSTNLMTTNINNNTVTKQAQCNQLRIYNKDFILVTYQQVFLLYITAIERKTLNDHRVLSLHFPQCYQQCAPDKQCTT